jgi:hypothetical protein
MKVGTALAAQTLTLSGSGIGTLVAANIAVFLNTSSTQVSNCTVGGYDQVTGVVTFTVTPSVSGMNTLYVKLAGISAAVAYTGSSGQGFFVDASGSTYTMPTSFTYTPTTGYVDSVATSMAITTTGASVTSATIAVLYGAAAGLTTGLMQCGTGTLASNAASVSVTIPQGTWYVYIKVTSPLGVAGPILGAAATLTSSA